MREQFFELFFSENTHSQTNFEMKKKWKKLKEKSWILKKNYLIKKLTRLTKKNFFHWKKWKLHDFFSKKKGQKLWSWQDPKIWNLTEKKIKILFFYFLFFCSKNPVSCFLLFPQHFSKNTSCLVNETRIDNLLSKSISETTKNKGNMFSS